MVNLISYPRVMFYQQKWKIEKCAQTVYSINRRVSVFLSNFSNRRNVQDFQAHKTEYRENYPDRKVLLCVEKTARFLRHLWR